MPPFGMRTFGSGFVIFGLKHIAASAYVLDDAVFLFERVVASFNAPKKHRAKNNGDQAGRLGIGREAAEAGVD